MIKSDFEEEVDRLKMYLDNFKRIEREEPELAGYLGFAGYAQFVDARFYQKERLNVLDEAEALNAKAKKEEAEQKALVADAEAEAAARMSQLHEAVTVTVYRKEFQKPFSRRSYDEFIALRLTVQNNLAKDIKALTGTVVFADLLGNPIKKVRFTYDEPLHANKATDYAATLKYNQFTPGDETLKNKELDKMRISWEPEKILFADGTTLEAESQAE